MTNDRFMIKCAVYIIFIKDRKIPLYRRVNTGWQDGKFGIPGGHLEENETLKQAAVREAKEETGLEVNEKDLQFVEIGHRQFIPGKSIESTHDYIDIVFLANRWKGAPSITEENKSDKFIWADPENLPENIIKSVKLIINSYLKKEGYFYFNG